jgi:hypothetical protein
MTNYGKHTEELIGRVESAMIFITRGVDHDNDNDNSPINNTDNDTERRGRVVSTSASYSAGPSFKSRQRPVILAKAILWRSSISPGK